MTRGAANGIIGGGRVAITPFGEVPVSQESRQGKPWEERLNEAGARFEEELKRVVQYIDKEVVPEVRHHGSIALRSAAEQLQKLAERMDDNKPPRSGHGSDGGPDGGGTSA